MIVCIKQVPCNGPVIFREESYTIAREKLTMETNPFDLFALEAALRIKDQYGGHITVLSMGIPSAETHLRDAIAMGADEAVLLSDPFFAGADTLATAYTPSMGINNDRTL